jgi:hypothetical protein
MRRRKIHVCMNASANACACTYEEEEDTCAFAPTCLFSLKACHSLQLRIAKEHLRKSPNATPTIHDPWSEPEILPEIASEDNIGRADGVCGAEGGDDGEDAGQEERSWVGFLGAGQDRDEEDAEERNWGEEDDEERSWGEEDDEERNWGEGDDEERNWGEGDDEERNWGEEDTERSRGAGLFGMVGTGVDTGN